jgi:hypothetical protein
MQGANSLAGGIEKRVGKCLINQVRNFILSALLLASSFETALGEDLEDSSSKDLKRNNEWAEFLGVSHQSSGVSTIVNGRAFTSKGIVTRVRDTYFSDGGITIKTKDSYYGPSSYATKVGDNYFTSRSGVSDKTMDRESKSGITTVIKDTYNGTSVYQTKTRDGYFYGNTVR